MTAVSSTCAASEEPFRHPNGRPRVLAFLPRGPSTVEFEVAWKRALRLGTLDAAGGGVHRSHDSAVREVRVPVHAWVSSCGTPRRSRIRPTVWFTMSSSVLGRV